MGADPTQSAPSPERLAAFAEKAERRAQEDYDAGSENLATFKRELRDYLHYPYRWVALTP